MRTFALLLLCLSGCLQLTETQSPANDGGWTLGLEQELIRHGAVLFQVLRIDPAQYTFRAHYQPDTPMTISGWQTQLPDAEAIINANFFTPEYAVLGLLISDGVVYGAPYQNRGGTFYVDQFGVAGLHSNVTQPYQNDPYRQAIQAFPMLVEGGIAVYNNPSDTAISRRTVIAIDVQGRILLMVTAGFGLSLSDLSEYLAQSDLEIVTALNLDGGGSTMMSVTATDTTILSVDPVPSVLAVYRR